MKKSIIKRLKNTKGFMFNLDGTLVLGDRKNKGLKPLPGAIEFIRHLNKKAIPYVLFTNGTVRPIWNIYRYLKISDSPCLITSP